MLNDDEYKNMLLFNYKINVFDSNGQTCRHVCNATTHIFFCSKIEQTATIYSIDLCMSTISLCPITHLYLIDIAVKVLVLRLFSFN